MILRFSKAGYSILPITHSVRGISGLVLSDYATGMQAGRPQLLEVRGRVRTIKVEMVPVSTCVDEWNRKLTTTIPVIL